MAFSSLNKKRLLLVIGLVLLIMHNSYAKDRIGDWKVMLKKRFSMNTTLIDLFIDNNNNLFLVDYNRDSLYMNNDWIKVSKYGRLLNGFLKDGQFYLAFHKDEHIVICKVQEDIKPISHVRINYDLNKPLISPYYYRIVPVSGQQRLYYLLGSSSQFPAHPLEFLSTLMSAGHGTYYAKPFLAQIQNNEMLKGRKIRYGWKIDETYIVEEVAYSKNSIHFLGFRGREASQLSGPVKFAKGKPVILHYANYEIKKKKTTRKHSIYENTPRFDKDTKTDFDYGPLSIDNQGDNVFVVFSWVTSSWNETESNDTKGIISEIYYWQFYNDSPGDVEKIGEGFMPLVKVDLSGVVHVFWVNRKGGLVHKARQDNKWSKEKIILNNVDISSGIRTIRYISAEFDKDDNLNVVFPSDENLVYAKIKLE
jgi:hypothetical protein